MDESLDFLCEAADYLDRFIPISDTDVILEATPFAKKANENNTPPLRRFFPTPHQ